MIQVHLQYWANSVDPIIWMRIARVMFFVAAGALMLREPMMCGGRNQVFHRLLSGVFFLWAYYSWDTAYARMILIGKDALIPTTATLLISEIAMTAAAIAVVVKLGIDYVQWREYHKVDLHKDCNGICTIMADFM